MKASLPGSLRIDIVEDNSRFADKILSSLLIGLWTDFLKNKES